MKVSAVFKSLRITEKKIGQINFSLGSGIGREEEKKIPRWMRKVGFSNEKTFFKSVTKIKTLTAFFDPIMKSRQILL